VKEGPVGEPWVPPRLLHTPPMAVREGEADTEAGRAAPLAALSAAARALAEGTTLAETLEGVARAVARALGATVAVVRVVDEDRCLRARAVVTSSTSLAAELASSSIPLSELPAETDERGELPEAIREAAGRAGAEAVLLLPVEASGKLLGSLELLRPRDRFGFRERMLARIAADHVAAAIRRFDGARANGAPPDVERTLELVGEALVAGGETATELDVARVARHASGAAACLLWQRRESGELRLVATQGTAAPAVMEAARPIAEIAVVAARSGEVESVPGGGTVLTFALGQPARHVLQLAFPDGTELGDGLLARLGTFAARAAQALRAGERARTLGAELARTRTLLEVVAQASEELSLSHTLETAVERVADVLDAERIAIYLWRDGRLRAAAARSLTGPHEPIAERLLQLVLGPQRGRGILVLDDVAADPAFAALDLELAETAIEAAAAVPLLVPGEVVGLLAVYLPAGRRVTRNERSLLAALAAQLAVSVQNARLHEEATRLGKELEQVLALERQAARQLGSLYEISRSFAQSLSLEATLEAAASTVVDLLDVDAAVVRMRDARGANLVPRALHVADVRVADALRAIVSRPQPLDGLPVRRLRTGEALTLDADSAARLPAHTPLLPFLEKGATAVVVPIATSSELLGTLEIVSLDPGRPITHEATEIAKSVAAQAALALDNARLYQQQKEFADAMQRALLPHADPDVEGLEVGHVYASSAHVDVGGDLYDFLALEDGRLAVVLGDVTGHGVEAAADMAMTKFVFRSLARENPEPGDFLEVANAVVCDEIAPGKFVTMLYMTADPATGALAAASGGHPLPRILLPDGTVRVLEARGLALGIDPDQRYDAVSQELPPGAAVILYTDGLVEARRGREFYGTERLDAALAGGRELGARELAQAVLDDCREFGGRELADDCAIVVIRRAG
jgi:serine phosphatase RsbU (regulator of sigma subunit)